MSTTESTAQDEPHECINEIRTVSLPPRVQELADEYDRLFEERDRFLWKWIHSLFPSFTLSTVADEYAAHVRTQKTILTMYVTILDDIVEQRGDRRTFDEVCRLRTEGQTADPGRARVDQESFEFIERVWRTFEDGIVDAPRYDEFADVFEYDLEQTMNAMEYSAMVNENPEIANLRGARRYESHNMVMFPYADVDLMYAPEFETSEFGAVRDLLWDLQEMARIGNWLTTWEREVDEGDFTAGIVVFALEEGIVTPDELDADEDVVDRIKSNDVEELFRQRWANRYRAVRERQFDADTVDLDRLIDGMETVYEYHIATRGLK
ncbi:hypothetical protein [Halovenus marina]|uniref:hypothetical protein n=1 Tax=Halovenus marina TaxID=3396621 RepID=UPI003F54CBD2